MRVIQKIAKNPADLARQTAALADGKPDLLIVFGAVNHFTAPDFASTLRAALPGTVLIGCTTAGEITPDGVDDGTCTLTGISFDAINLIQANTQLSGMDDSFAAGERLGKVAGLIETGANAVLRVGGDDGSERLLPFVAAVVLAVEKEAGVIRVAWGSDW